MTSFALTLSQQDIYFDQLHAPDSPRYNIGGYIRFDSVDVTRLQRAHGRMVASHDAFGLRIDGPAQFTTAERTVALPVLEFASREAADEWLRIQFRTLFTIERSELFRACLLKIADVEYRYVVVAHHLMIDGWGFSNLARVLGELYDQCSGGLSAPPAGSGPARRSAEDVSWQERAEDDAAYVASDRYAENARYWAEHCTPLPEPALTPFHRARFHGLVPSERETLVLPREDYNGHGAAAAEMGVGIAAYFMAMIARLAGRKRLILGVPSHNRRTHAQKKQIGVYIGINPLAIDVLEDDTLATLAARIQQTQKKNYRHARYPIGHTIRDLGLREQRLYDIGFNYLQMQNEAEIHYLSHGHEPTPLSITVFENGDTLPVELQFDYRLDSLDTAEAKLLVQRFAHLLETGELLSPADRAITANAPDTSFPDARIEELFERHAARTPDAIALVSKTGTLTYRELNERANELARQLPAGELVAICTERSIEAIVGTLAVLKAGAAYLPLDPNYPESRKRFMLEDSGARFMITSEGIVALDDSKPRPLARIPHTQRRIADTLRLKGVPLTRRFAPPSPRKRGEGRRVVALLPACGEKVPPSASLRAGSGRMRGCEKYGLDDSSIAYVMYTSGSTGQPKGVMVEHRGVVRLVVDNNYAPLNAGTRILQVSSYGFDAATFEIWGALLNGGALVLYPESHIDLQVLNEQIDTHSINTILLTAALFEQWSHQLPKNDSLRYVLSGGDVVSPGAVARVYDAMPLVTVVNAYGPTENSVMACCHAVPRQVDLTRTIPLGRKINGTSLHVLDRNLNPLPAGAVGELHVGGPGVARGYWNRPELTAEKFITVDGERLYKTGDLVRYLPDGNLTFIGRADQQVKVRGFRIEPGEIEAQLLRIEGIREAAVVVKGEGADKSLTAYYVGEGEPREELARLLPAHMIPTAFVRLEALPLNASGKVDRKALPDPDVRAEHHTVAPATAIESRIAAVWQDVLKLEDVSVTANFFELGGDSLLAMRIASAFDGAIPVRAIFEHKTIRTLAAWLDAQDAAAGETIPLAPRNEPLPLSFAQQRLWFIDQLEQGSVEYNMPAALRLRGTLGRDALQSAFDGLVARHEVLRTRFVGGMQEIRPAAPVVMRELAVTEDAIDALAHAEALRPFDLANDLMLRVTLLRLAEDDHVLLLTLHHIAADGWSAEILMGELSALYAGQSLPPLPIQYADYAQWQRAQLQGETFARQLDYWKTQLADLPPVHDLPLDKPRPAQQSFAGGAVVRCIDAPLLEKLHALAHEHSASLFMVLHSAFALLLGRWSRSSEIVIGTPVAGREHRALDPLIGCFVNTLVLRTRLFESLSFAALLEQGKQTALDAYAHQSIPFEKLVAELSPERSLSHGALCQIILSVAAALVPPQLPGLDVTLVGGELPFTKFDLNLMATEQGGALELRWNYALDLFEQSTIQRMAASFETLLGAIVEAPRQSIHALPLVERASVVESDVEYPALRIHTIFEQQAANTPDATAVIAADSELTYAELNERANRLAHVLIGKGVEAGEIVGLCTERGIDGIVGTLAILKAGAAYLPLDPGVPEERSRYMLEDGAVRFVLTQMDLMGGMPLDLVRALPIDMPVLMASAPRTDPDVAGTPADLAYVMYTSGSTGQPKGVLVEHRGVVRLIVNNDYVPLNADTRILQAANVAFDAATFEIWGSLLHGGQLVLYPENVIDLGVLNQQLEAHAVNTLWLTAGLFDQWSHQLPKRSALRYVLAGGDVINPAAVARVYAALPGVTVINGYGPTENTTFSCCYSIPRDADLTQPIPLGRRINGTSLHILDGHGLPVPDGAVGELSVGGAGVARGYLNQPALTAEKFVDGLYRTGDLVRVLPDGNLAFIGRVDEQVKLRGFRIEPGEIEAQLLRIGGIREAVVLVKGAGSEKYLAAYVVGDLGHDELRQLLRQTLPDYMVPTAFVRMDALPLNANGKVDRKALPEPERQAEHTYVAPRNETEARVARLWQEVLGLSGDVSVTANFFELGGDSLLAMRIAGATSGAFQKTLPVRVLFEHNTVRALAAWLEQQSETVHCAIPVVPRTEALPLSFAQQRLWFIDQLEQGSAQYNMPAALRLQGTVDRDALQATFDTIVARHEVLRTRFIDGAQDIRRAEPVPMRTIDLTPMPETLDALVKEEAARPFDLAHDLMLRVALVKIADDEHVLLVTMHHIASDAWSVDVLVGEVSALYDAYSRGEANPLPPLPIQYADYTVWHRHQLQGETYERQLAYWKTQLADLPRVHSLPLDKPRPAQQRFAGASLVRTLDAGLVSRLELLGRAHNASLFMVLQSAFALLIGRWSRSTDVVLGTPVAGREHRALDPLIGFFVNTLVLRTRLSAEQSFDALLGQAKQTALDAFAHQTVPFEMLVDELKPERSLSQGALFQIMFSLLGGEPGRLALPGLAVTPLAQDFSLSKFDLSLIATEGDDGLQLRWLYATSLFERETIERMADSFRVLLHGIAATPRTPVYELPLLDDAGHGSMLALSRGPIAAEARNECVHRLFEAQVARTPKAKAAGAMSYRELNGRANRIAHALLAKSLGGARVGLYAERSEDVLIGMLGILKAGATYVPFEPGNTPERLRHILDNAEITCAVVQPHLVPNLPEGLDLMAFDIDGPAHDPGVDVRLEDSAYVMYTSGSTGVPKGVEITHAGLADYCAFASQNYYAGHLEGSFVVTSHGFDITVPSLYVPLLRGGRVQLATPGDELTELAAILARDKGAYLLRMTPMHLSGVLSLLPPTAGRQASTARHVFVVGGEAFPTSLARELQTRFPGAQIFNHYGPTETVVGCAMYDVTASLASAGERLPIGRAMANHELYVLNEAMQLNPIGVPGELHIGGAGVAKGYVNQPAVTAQKFVRYDNARVYRSGDVVRWLPTGDLDFLGRVDDQIKIRGFRIEPGEIESVLRTVVKDALVVVQGEGEHRALAAYVVGDASVDALKTLDALKARLRAALPEYMIPTGWCVLESFPLNANGKIDRQALPAIEREVMAHVAPSTETERRLAELWREILKLDTLPGVTANFFELGGQSLLATRVASAASAEFNRAIPVRALFEYSTVQALAAHLDALDATEHRAMRPVPRGGELPMSFAQQRLWFLDQLTGGSPQYNMPAAFRLRGRLDHEALQNALDEIVRRHEVLRTNYVSELGQGRQILREAKPVSIARFSITEERVQELAREEAGRPFDLTGDLMFRVALLALADDEHVLLFTMHHIASDGWSIAVLAKEFMALYGAYSAGHDSPLAPLALQYADYAFWQREWLQGDVLERQVAYWRTRLDGIPPVHSLPLDKPRRALQGFEGERWIQNVDAALLRGLNALARRQNASLYMVLQSALALLVGRWSNETDIVIGNTIAGRTHKDVEALIGFFVNNVVLRTDLAAAATFDELVAQVKQSSLDAHANQDVPFEMLVEELKVERGLRHAPLVQIVFTFRNNERAEVTLPGLVVKNESETFGTSRFDLELLATETGRGLELAWSFSTDIFERHTIERFGASFEQLLRSAVAAPGATLQQLSIVTVPYVGEQDQAWPERLCIHELFEERAAETPEAIAVVFENDFMTYGQLNAAANRLARYLVDKNVQPDSLVALCTERSFDMVVGMLGILKAGAAYVPIDPNYPEERIEQILEDSGVAMVLTQGELLELNPSFNDHPVLPIDSGFRDVLLARYGDENLKTGVTPRNLAYVIYTSGSTGTPKGAMVEHRSVVRLVIDNHYVPLNAGTRILQISTSAFDAATFEIWGALLNGGRLILYPESRIDLTVMNAQIEQHAVNTMFVTTGLFDQWSYQLPAGHCLRWILTGGDVTSPASVARVYDALPAVLVSNIYGPTENTTFSTYYPVARDADLTQPLPIGKKINGTSVHVLDRAQQLLPDGAIGELYCGGPGVARGYLHRPELTAEKFVTVDGERLYRTGDLVRRLPDGNIAFIGRVDNQVKIRGFRIEPGEIEAKLLQVTGVRDAVVLAQGERTNKYLAAYVVPELEWTDVEESDWREILRASLKQTLPEHMIPTAFVRMTALPLNANGKVDHKALPEPERQAQDAYVAPGNAVESRIAEIWQEILKLDTPISASADFFDLGGNSLSLLRVKAYIERSFEVELHTRLFFEYPTVRGIATAIGLLRTRKTAAEFEEHAELEVGDI